MFVYALGIFLVIYAFKFAMYAGLNQGILTTLFTTTAIFNAAVFYFLY